jgi:hypothetical protein
VRRRIDLDVQCAPQRNANRGAVGRYVEFGHRDRVLALLERARSTRLRLGRHALRRADHVQFRLFPDKPALFSLGPALADWVGIE